MDQKNLILENKKFTKVSIFMNVLIVMLIGFPVQEKLQKFYINQENLLNASLDKASEDNERNYYKISNSNGEDIIVVQIAGLIARRIVCEVKADDELNQGDRIGMIRFGSRADIIF